MKFSEVRRGRTFVLRLEHGDIIHEEIERFAREHSISAAALIILGGADAGSTFIVGPDQGLQRPFVPMKHLLENVHEVGGTGTLFPDEKGNPLLHMHIACGRNGSTVTGCIREGVRVWHIMEAVLFELIDTPAARRHDPETGFELLQL
jgi:predicted DNA-binding protein with PD1-like motif